MFFPWIASVIIRSFPIQQNIDPFFYSYWFPGFQINMDLRLLNRLSVEKSILNKADFSSTVNRFHNQFIVRM